MATSVFNQGSYTVSGIAPPRKGVAEQFQAGLQANLGRQEVRGVMAAREEATRLAQNADKRAQTELEMRQEAMRQQQARANAAAARAAARAAQQRAAFKAYTAATTADPTGSAAGVRRPVDDFRPSGGNFPLATPAQRSSILPELGFPAAPVAPAAQPSAGVQFPSVFNQGAVTGGGGVSILGSDTETDRLGTDTLAGYGAGQVDPGLMRAAGLSFAGPPAAQDASIPTLPDGSPDWATFGQMLDTAGEGVSFEPPTTDLKQYGPAPLGVDQITSVDPTASAAMQDVQALSRRVDINNAALRIGNSVLQRTSGLADYIIRTPEEGAQRAKDREQGQTVSDWYRSAEAQGIFQADQKLLAEAARDPLAFYQQYADEPVQTGTDSGGDTSAAPAQAIAPPAPPARTGKDPFIIEEEGPTGPVAGLSPAGATNPVAAAAAAANAAPGGDTSAYLISNPTLVLDLQTQMARERQVLEARLQYAQQTGNRALFDQTFDALNSKERVLNENLMSGQIAILAAQQDNFGPLQELMQRAYPNDSIEVIPYTNGTVSFFINGEESDEPMQTADLLDSLAQTFNTEYREELAAAAALRAERDQFVFENTVLQQLQAAREISVETAKALAELESAYGEVTFVSDLASGDKLFQTTVPERGRVQFRIVEVGRPLLNGKPAVTTTVEEVPMGTMR